MLWNQTIYKIKKFIQCRLLGKTITYYHYPDNNDIISFDGRKIYAIRNAIFEEGNLERIKATIYYSPVRKIYDTRYYCSRRRLESNEWLDDNSPTTFANDFGKNI